MTTQPADTSDLKTRILQACAAGSGLDFNNVENIWIDATRLLQIPLKAQGLFFIAINLRNIIPLVKQRLDQARNRWNLSDVYPTIDAWLLLIEAIPPDLPLRKEEILTSYNQSGYSKAPLHGVETDYPVWSMLWFRHFRPAHEPLPSLYREIQGELLSAHIIFLLRGLAPETENRFSEAGRLVRQLNRKELGAIFEQLCEGLPRAGAGGPEQWANAALQLRQGLNASSQGSQRQGAGALAQILIEAHDLPEPSEPIFRARSGGSRHNTRTFPLLRRSHNIITPGHAYFEVLQGRGLDHVAIYDGLTTLHYNSVDKDTRHRLNEEGIDPDEFDEPGGADIDTDGLLGEDKRHPKDLPPLGSLFAKARGKARHTAARAQRLPVTLERIRLTPLHRLIQEMNALFLALNDDLTGIEDIPDSKRNDVRNTLRLAAISLGTGSPVDQVLRRVAFKSVSNLPAHYPLALNKQHRMWIRPYIPPERQPMTVSGGHLGARPLQQRVAFPDTLGVMRHCDEAPTAKKGAGEKFTKLWDQYVAPRLSRHAIPASWTTLESMGEILPSWFAGLDEGDHLTNAILFGREDRFAKTQHFYTTYDRLLLAGIFQQRVIELWQALGFACDDHTSSNPPGLFTLEPHPLNYDRSWVGDDRVPCAESLHDLTGKCRAVLLSSPPETLDDWCERHNHMALYTGLGLALTTGFRSINTPIPDLEALHKDTRTLCLQEKDRLDGRHARLVMLPAPVVQQISLYLDHLRSLILRLPPSIRLSIHVPSTKMRDRARYGHEGFVLDLRKSLFFMERDDRGQWHGVEFSGHRFKTLADRLIPDAWPVNNAGRHFLKTHLVNEGCPAGLSNILMGHWQYGEEPWNSHSTLDPVAFRHALAPYLDRLLDRVGYIPSTGMQGAS